MISYHKVIMLIQRLYRYDTIVMITIVSNFCNKAQSLWIWSVSLFT